LGDQAERQGVVFTGAMEDAARQADKSGDQISRAIEGIQNQISIGLATHGGNSLKQFFAEAATGFAEFLTWINKSNDELGKFQIDTFKGQARFIPGRQLREEALTLNVAGVPIPNPYYGQPFAPPISGEDASRFARDASRREPFGTNPFQGAPDPFGKIETKEIDEAAKKFAEESAKYMRQEITAILDSSFDPIGLDRLNPIRDAGGLTPTDRYLGGTASRQTVPEDLQRANLEAFRKQEQDAKRRAEESEKLIDDFVNSSTDILASSFATFITDAVTGVKTLQQAFQALAQSLVTQILQTGIEVAIKAALLHGGGIPVHAANGLVMAGVRGQDTVPALLRHGEMVTDTETTNYFKQILPRLDRFIAEGGGGSGQHVSVSLNIERIDAGLNDPLWVRDVVNTKIMPEIARAVRYGTASRAA
jgi:hypothetical protein